METTWFKNPSDRDPILFVIAAYLVSAVLSSDILLLIFGKALSHEIHLFDYIRGALSLLLVGLIISLPGLATGLVYLSALKLRAKVLWMASIPFILPLASLGTLWFLLKVLHRRVNDLGGFGGLFLLVLLGVSVLGQMPPSVYLSLTLQTPVERQVRRLGLATLVWLGCFALFAFVLFNPFLTRAR